MSSEKPTSSMPEGLLVMQRLNTIEAKLDQLRQSSTKLGLEDDGGPGRTENPAEARVPKHANPPQMIEPSSKTPPPMTTPSPGPEPHAHSAASMPPIRGPASMRPVRGERIHKWRQFLEEPESSSGANVYCKAMSVFILLSLIIIMIQVCDPTILKEELAAGLETVFDIIFTIEFLARFMCAHSKQKFFLNMFNIIDMAPVIVLIYRCCIGFVLEEQVAGEFNVECFLLLGVNSVLRLLKCLQRFEEFRLIICAFQITMEALPVLVYIYVTIILFFTALLYLVEPTDNILSLSGAMWLTVNSMTGLDFPDPNPPESSFGKILVQVIFFINMIYLTIPLGVVGNAFSAVWSDRDRILLCGKTRDRLKQRGFAAQNIPQLVEIFDENTDGKLDLHEFQTMITEMKLGVSKSHAVNLFFILAGDGEGAIDDRDIVRALFPSSFLRIYGSSDRWHAKSEHIED